jgi:hemerythrin-like domain-containing protein
MEQATQILRKEHDAILKMLEAATRTSERLERGQPVDPQILDDLLEFFRLFADQCHHGKEEELLFPVLEKKGVPRAGGPIGVMLDEHEQARKLIADMSASAAAFRYGDSSAGAHWARDARQYVDLLSRHISKENNVLFVMAESVLSEAEQQEIAAAFARLEIEKMGEGTHERLHAKMDKVLAETAARSGG